VFGSRQLRCNDPAFVAFLEGCLCWDAHARMTPDEALRHEWIAEAPPPRRGAGAGAGAAATRHTSYLQPVPSVPSVPNSLLASSGEMRRIRPLSTHAESRSQWV